MSHHENVLLRSASDVIPQHICNGIISVWVHAAESQADRQAVVQPFIWENLSSVGRSVGTIKTQNNRIMIIMNDVWVAVDKFRMTEELQSRA